MDSIEIIKTILAPAVMINCCGLFLLGMNNRYSVVVGRIRSMEDEKRKLTIKKLNEILNEPESIRYNSLQYQTSKLFYRVLLIRNAVVFYNLAVAFFIITCLIIGLLSISEADHSASIIYIPFFIGLLAVLTGVSFATMEIFRGYEIVKIEVAEDLIHIPDENRRF
jgi:hypothetical protein